MFNFSPEIMQLFLNIPGINFCLLILFNICSVTAGLNLLGQKSVKTSRLLAGYSCFSDLQLNRGT